MLGGMKMISYEVNCDTLALIPVSENETKVIAPIIVGLRIVPLAMEPVDIRIPISIGVIISIVLVIIFTVSNAKL